MDETTRPTGTDDADAIERRGLGRRQITGILFGVAGIALILGVAPAISGDTKAFAFEPPPDPLELSFDPPTVVIAVGVLYLVTAALSLLPATYDIVARRTQIVSAALAIPLILAVALALSEAPTTNVTNLLDESLVLATPIALGSMTGLWCERSGIINIGIEGMMLAAAGVGFMVFAVLGEAASTPWLWFAILVAVMAAVMLLREGAQLLAG